LKKFVLIMVIGFMLISNVTYVSAENDLEAVYERLRNEYLAVCDMSDGLIRVVSESSRHGFVDANGNVVIPLNYRGAGDFSEGYARIIGDDGKYGTIDKQGEVVITPKYDYMGSFENSVAIIDLDDKHGLVDYYGNEVIAPIYDDRIDFGDADVLKIRKNNKWGIIDKAGNEIIPLIYDYFANFNEGIALVRKDNKYGFINVEGQPIIELKYDLAAEFKYGLSIVQNESMYGLIDKIGNEVVPIKYDRVQMYSDGTLMIEIDSKQYNFIASDGKLISIDDSTEKTEIENSQVNVDGPFEIKLQSRFTNTSRSDLDISKDAGIRAVVSKFGKISDDLSSDAKVILRSTDVIYRPTGEYSSNAARIHFVIGGVNINVDETLYGTYSEEVKSFISDFMYEVYGEEDLEDVLKKAFETTDATMVTLDSGDVAYEMISLSEKNFTINDIDVWFFATRKANYNYGGTFQSYQPTFVSIEFRPTITNDNRVVSERKPNEMFISKNPEIRERMSKYGTFSADSENAEIMGSSTGMKYYPKGFYGGDNPEVMLSFQEGRVFQIKLLAYNNTIKSMITDFMISTFDRDLIEGVAEKVFSDIEGTKSTTSSGRTTYATSLIVGNSFEVNGMEITYSEESYFCIRIKY